MQQQQPTAAQTIDQVTKALNQSIAQRAELHDQLAANEKQVLALRNLVQGVELGKKLAADAAEAAAKAAVPQPSE